MKKIIVLSAVAALVVILHACFGTEKKVSPLQQTLARYHADAAVFVAATDALQQAVERNQTDSLRSRFVACRLAYKKIEWLLAYYNPLTAKNCNGPAIAEVEPSDKAVIIEPEGLQVIETFLYPDFDSANAEELRKQVRRLRSTAGRVQTTAAALETTDAHVLDAVRLQLFRTVALGLSGFDAPLSGNTVNETEAVLQTLEHVLQPYRLKAAATAQKESNLVANKLAAGLAYLNAVPADSALDKAEFIRVHLNGISAAVVDLQKALHLPFFTEPRALRADAPTLFSPNAINAAFYVPDAEAMPTPQKTTLGEKLFYDAALSGNGKRSCASCHQPEKAFADGLPKATALDGHGLLKRNTPTLINAALQPSLFYDMRVSFLEDQAGEVIQNPDEMHGDFSKAASQLQKDSHYRQAFKAAYGDKPVSAYSIKNALASYLRSLVRFTTPFDRYMQGAAAALNAKQLQGFNLFMGKAKCGTCHFLPLFSGVNPPDFARMDAEIIGVPAFADAKRKTLDADEGKFGVYQIDLHRFAFKTPTLRNVALTAPYMHNGVFKTLEEVVDFYNRGGGEGLGFRVPNQTLPAEPLRLSGAEREALVTFMRSLTDENVGPVCAQR